MRRQLICLGVSLAVAAVSTLLFETPSRADEQAVSLGDLRTFDVQDFEQTGLELGRSNLPPELVEYAREAIQTDERLRYSSPGQGVVHLYCETPDCGRLRIEVTQGPDGPMVWQTTETYRSLMGKLFMFQSFQPDNRKFAKMLVSRLATDYEKSLKAVPTKIEIKEE